MKEGCERTDPEILCFRTEDVMTYFPAASVTVTSALTAIEEWIR